MSRTRQLVDLPVGEADLEGDLVVPTGASGVVLFANGSGSSRQSPRDDAIAERLRESGIGTFRFDLLTGEETLAWTSRFDVPTLTDRLASVTRWIDDQPATAELPTGYVGAGTGAAAALLVATRSDVDVDAVVSRGGRVDLADQVVARLDVPCLFVVGTDADARERTERTVARMTCERRLEVLDGADRPDAVATLAADWFREHLG